MRQQHQKSRSRGRNRKPQNPMSRNYESNGPDVKIRGNAAHIADKYSSLARDAQSNGDTVMAENYLQHAEHYNRIVAAAQAQKAEEQAAAAANGRGPQPDVSDSDDTPANEAQSTSDDKNQAESASEDSAGEADETPKERKNGRGRRTKRASAEQNGDASSEKTADNSAEQSESEPSVDVEAISEDAASLPTSITGGLQVEEG